ncbi:MAG: hypothetical protein EZS28_025008, partial [Streblomastix strix]
GEEEGLGDQVGVGY